MNNYKRSKIFGKKEKLNFFIVLCLVIGVISVSYLTIKGSMDQDTYAEKSENKVVQNSMKSEQELNVNESTMDNAIQVKDTNKNIASGEVLGNSTEDSKVNNNLENSDSNIDLNNANSTSDTNKEQLNFTEEKKDNTNPLEKNTSGNDLAKEDTKEVVSTEPKEEVAQVSSNKSITFVSPVEGSLIRGYTTDTIYSKTLNSWRTREGIDLKAEKGTNVVSVLDGVVEKIDNDLTERGQYIVINHDGGFKTIYTNLDDEVKVVSGQKVKQGEVIGKVGNSSGNYSNEDYGTHLNFVMYLNNEEVNPAEYLKLK